MSQGNPQVSRNFEECFDNEASRSHSLCKCGRIHFDRFNGYGGDWETRQLPDFLAMAEKRPEKYIAREGMIYSYVINGLGEYVVGCACNGGGTFEKFLKDNAMAIASYLNKMAADLRKKADLIEIDSSTLS
jgi:hypothetical protein